MSLERTAAFVVCPLCDLENCVGRKNCKELQDEMKNILENTSKKYSMKDKTDVEEYKLCK